MNARRGHETSTHLHVKQELGARCESIGWSTFYEEQGADIVIRHYQTGFIAAIEVESSPRNVTRNIERNIAHGCDAVAVVSLNDRFLRQIANKVMSSSIALNHGKVRLFPLDSRGINDMLSWLIDLTWKNKPLTEKTP